MKRKNILSIKAAVIIGISFILIQSGLGVVGNGNFSPLSFIFTHIISNTIYNLL